MVRTLDVVGVGSSYHGRTFADFGRDGEVVREALGATWPETLASGRGITVFGESGAAGQLHMMMAYAAHMSGATIRATGPAGLAVLLEQQGDDLYGHPLDDVRIVFIRNFMDGGRRPLMPSQHTRIEEYLDTLLDRGGAVFPRIKAMQDDVDRWWSPALLQRLNERNQLVRVS